MKRQPQSLSDLLDLAEELRQKGELKEAAEVVKRSLRENSGYPRAQLLLARLLYQEGKILEARAALRLLESVLNYDAGFKSIAKGMEQLRQIRDAATAPAFITETMAQLLAKQGYLLESIETYRRLYLASKGEKRYLEKILLLRNRLKEVNSRGLPREKVARELEVLEQWLEERGRDS